MSNATQKLPDDSANTGHEIDCEAVVLEGKTVLQQRVRLVGIEALASAANQDAIATMLSALLALADSMGINTAEINAKTPALQGGAVPAQIIGPVTVGYIASNGVVIPADSLAATHTIVAGQIAAITVSYLGINYVQTLTYTSGIVSAVSNWVAQ